MSNTDEHAVWFTSTEFFAEIGEDEETNPRMYGRQPARWLCAQLIKQGYDVEEAFGEDWGWCVMCQRQPYDLFLGCVNVTDRHHAQEGDPPPAPEKLLWIVHVMSDVPFWRSLFKGKPDVTQGEQKLFDTLMDILNKEPTITVVDEAIADTWFSPTIENTDDKSRNS